jgi:hypothetical protein
VGKKYRVNGMKNYLSPLRSPMGNFCNIVSDSSPWNKTDYFRSRKIHQQLEKTKDVISAEIEKAKEKLFPSGPNTRFTIARKSQGGFTCTGLGFIPAKDFSELKQIIRDIKTDAGKKFNRIKMGCIVAKLD